MLLNAFYATHASNAYNYVSIRFHLYAVTVFFLIYVLILILSNLLFCAYVGFIMYKIYVLYAGIAYI